MTRRTLVLLACLSLVCAAQSASTAPAPTLPANVRQILSWLPADTESIRVGGQAFVYPTLPREEGALDPAKVGPPNLLTLLPVLSVETLEKVEGIQSLLQGRRVLAAIDGRRHLQGGPFGVVRSESCTVAMFETGLTPDPLLRRGKLEQIGGQTVASFESNDKYLSQQLWVALPRPNLVIACSDHAFLQTVLQRIDTPTGPRALPDTLPEWKHAITNAPFWAFRHYGAREADSYAPFGFENPSPVEGDANAVGITMAYQPEHQKGISLTHFTSATDVREAVRMSMFQLDVPIPDPDTEVRQVGPGAVEVRTGMTLVESGWGLAMLFRLLGAI